MADTLCFPLLYTTSGFDVRHQRELLGTGVRNSARVCCLPGTNLCLYGVDCCFFTRPLHARTCDLPRVVCMCSNVRFLHFSKRQVRGSALRDEFSCPITRELMRDPVIAADGHTYDREAIEMWLRNHDTSPKVTNETPTYLVP